MYQNIRLEIENDYDAMSRKAAQIFARAMREHPQGAFGYASGSTPIGLYQELVRMHKEEGLDFSGVTTFNLDEYYPIKRESNQSYYYYMQHNLFSHVNVNQNRVHIPNGEAADAESEADDYEKKILSAGGIIMQILGIGMNGHIGFNEPSDSFVADTRQVPLTEVTVDSNSRFFESAGDVPRHAIAMGIRSIMLAKHIIFVAAGESKAAIMRDAFLGPITPLVPASILQVHPSVTVVADKEAASLL